MKSFRLPLWAMFVVDFFAFAAFFGVFMLVHYVGGQVDGPVDQSAPSALFTKTTSDRKPVVPNTEGLDTSGQFGASFPERFAPGNAIVSLTDDRSIRNYLWTNGLDFYDAGGAGKFVGLYRSHDVFVSAMQVNTQITSLTSGNKHKECYYYIDIYVRNIDNLYTYASYSRTSMEDLVSLASTNLDFTAGLPIAAINGDYWGNTNHCLVAERNGAIISSRGDDGLPLYDYIYSDLCVLYYDGRMETYLPSQYNWDSISAQNPYQIWNFGPGLLGSDGKSLGKYSNDSYDHNVVNARHPRSILGYFEPGHYCFLTVDGRSDMSDGMTLPEVGLLMESIGCKQAYNMDGGDSTYSYYNGDILRQNWDRYDKDDARKIYDIICVGEVG